MPDFVVADGMYLMSLHTFVVESDGLRILVDACTGNAKDRSLIPEFDHQHRPFLENLTAASFAPDTIDIAVCTHLHVDHVGWNTRLVNGRMDPDVPSRGTCSALPISTAEHTPKMVCTPPRSLIPCSR